MTNWVVVAIGFAIIALAVVLHRNAEAFASLQQRQAKLMRYPKAMQSGFTPGLVRVGAMALVAMGVIWILSGLFLGDKM